MSIYTIAERQTVKSIVATLSIKRIPDSEILRAGTIHHNALEKALGYWSNSLEQNKSTNYLNDWS